jgi:hypothetical protein
MATCPASPGGASSSSGRAGMDLMPDPPGTRHRGRRALRLGPRRVVGQHRRRADPAGVPRGALTCVSDDAVGRFCLPSSTATASTGPCAAVGGEARTSLALSESRLEGHQTVIYRNGAADFAMTVADVEGSTTRRFSALVTTGTALAAEPSRSAPPSAPSRCARAAGCPGLRRRLPPLQLALAAEAAEVCGRARRCAMSSSATTWSSAFWRATRRAAGPSAGPRRGRADRRLQDGRGGRADDHPPGARSGRASTRPRR